MIARLQNIIENYKLNSSQFAEIIGVQRSSISHILSGRNKPSLDFILKVIEKFPEIDIDWLLFGKGEMFKEVNLFTNIDNQKKVESESKKSITDQVDSNPKVKESDESNEKDFIDIISNALFSDTPKSKEESSIKSIENQKEDSNNKSSQDSDLERVIVFYRNGKFKEYKPV